MQVVTQEDAQVRPCNAQPRHPRREKPPEPQPTHQIALTSYSLTRGERARAISKDIDSR